MNTPTPETDAKQKLKDMIGEEYVSTDFARKLERERDEWKEKCDKLAKALRELRDSEWLTLPGRANDIVETALATLNQRLAHAPRRRENPNEENDFMTTENTDTPLKAGYPSATCSPLDFAVLAGIRAAAKAGITPIALAVYRRDADKDALGGLPVMSAGTLQFDDWGTGCKYLPLFGSNNVATLEAERAFMEAVSLSHPRRAWEEARRES